MKLGIVVKYGLQKDDILLSQENLSFDQATFTKPLSCAVHGIKLLDITPGAEVLIFGAGPAGRMLLQLAKYGGSSKVVIADPNLSKLNKAKELGLVRQY